MRMGLVGAMLCLLGSCPAVARDAATSEDVLSHRRTASAYLRTGNAELALNEIEALESLLDGDAKRLATEARIASEDGDLPKAAGALARLRAALAAERRTHGIRILPDCISEAEAGLAAIDGSREARPSLASDEARETIRSRIAEAGASLRRCDGEAAREIASAPEFRRLIDGALASLAQIPAALDRRDGDLLHRLLIELRSFERLLAQRFG